MGYGLEAVRAKCPPFIWFEDSEIYRSYREISRLFGGLFLQVLWTNDFDTFTTSTISTSR